MPPRSISEDVFQQQPQMTRPDSAVAMENFGVSNYAPGADLHWVQSMFSGSSDLGITVAMEPMWQNSHRLRRGLDPTDQIDLLSCDFGCSFLFLAFTSRNLRFIRLGL